MNHLSPEDFIDILDGAREAPAHVSACEYCRQELAAMSAVMTSAAGVEVPEPSPLFWTHFSSRVGAAVAAEGAPRPRWFASWWFAVPTAIATTAAAVLIAVALRHAAPAPPPVEQAAVAAQASVASQAPGPSDDVSSRPLLADAASDPSLAFVVGLAEDINMDPAAAAGLGGGADDAADHAVSHLSDSELQRLAELLKARMPHEQAS